MFSRDEEFAGSVRPLRPLDPDRKGREIRFVVVIVFVFGPFQEADNLIGEWRDHRLPEDFYHVV